MEIWILILAIYSEVFLKEDFRDQELVQDLVVQVCLKCSLKMDLATISISIVQTVINFQTFFNLIDN